MMENYSLDPYEHQLFKVFEGHDIDNKGSLDKDGLLKLCETLQLEDKAIELTKVLLDDRKSVRVTFSEFKDALLNLLGTMQNRDTLDLNTSPEREVSPKFVYGSKKYGRRSRPRCEEIISNKEIDNNKIASATVQRSNSQNEVSYSKKRKTNVKLKRCTSFPSVNDQKPDVVFHSNVNSEVVCTENMLRQAWKKLGVGEDGFLNQTELVVVCDAIGLNKLADSVIRQLSNKLVMDYNKRISFQELLEALQQDETWNEFLTSTPPPQNQDFEVNLTLNSSTSYHDLKSLPHIKLGPDGTGLINTESILELWEQAGISSPKVLLADLGFKGRNINVHELTLVLDKEIKALNEFRIDHTCNPHAALLHAFLTLHQTEIRCLRNILEQMQEEREKLKCDVFEANNRATLLAQEVDDNVANMELNTQKHVKLLEQRHMELLKQATEQFTLEKEQMNFLNQELENKLKGLETEEVKVRDELVGTQKYCNLIEKENQELNCKISELEEIKNTLQKQIDVLEMEKIKSKDLEFEQREKLISKISELQFENTNLRDKHDEMVSKIEALSNENASLKNKNGFDGSEDVTDISVICEGVHLGTKRRNEKSSQELNSLEILGNESPRLEKVRKFGINYLQCERPFILNDSGYDTEQDNTSTTCGHSLQNEEFIRLQKRILNLEQLLKENSIIVPDSVKEDESEEKTNKLYKLRTCKYRNVLIDIKAMVNKMENNNEYQNLSKYLGKIIADTRIDDANSLMEEINLCKEQLRKVESEKHALAGKCEDLENGLSLLRNEYEKCEDYWQNKLDDERRLFEQEQNHNSEKLNELLTKLGEFEDQYLKDSNRLPTIIEADNLEKQFTDLELEFKEYKEYMQMEVEGKDAEIFELKEKLQELHTYYFKEKCEVGIQAEDDNAVKEKQLNLTNHVIESTNFYSADAMPFNWNQTILQNFTIDQAALENFPHSWNKEESSNDATSVSSQLQGTKEKSFSLFTLPSTSHTNVWEHKTMPFRQKRTRNHDKVLSQHRLPKKNNEKFKNIDTETISDYGFTEVAADKNNDQKCLIPLSMLNNLHAKRYHLEQRCKKLQWILKQQHQYDEQLLHCSWQQHRNERSELQYCIKYYHDKLEQQLQITNEQQERLAKNDSLVKDLFVDNSYLLAKNQRLEQQYQMLANNLNTNSV